MNLSTHFALAEFTASDTAARMGINNDLPLELVPAATVACELLERIRAHLGERAAKPVPLLISSGYRCAALNRAIGSSDTSDHIRAMAVDFRAPAFGTPLQVSQALALVADSLNIGQLIYEHTWIHVSTRRPDKLLNRILTVAGKDYVPGIVA